MQKILIWYNAKIYSNCWEIIDFFGKDTRYNNLELTPAEKCLHTERKWINQIQKSEKWSKTRISDLTRFIHSIHRQVPKRIRNLSLADTTEGMHVRNP